MHELLCCASCCAVLCRVVQGVVRRDEDFWQTQWRRLKRMMFEVSLHWLAA
jgi:hypothetical protein